jgi:hypothetical protein
LADWRKPLTVLDTEPGDEMYIVNGRLVRSLKVIFDRESTERIRQGYACAKCLQVFEVPWPERCPTCGAPIRARQQEYFEREVSAQIAHLGPRHTLAEEIEGIHERAAKAAEEERKRNGR